MNERIRELSAQSLVKSEGQWVFSQEKFAELIVQECAGICDAYGMPDGTSPTAMILSRAIKKHFGVKE